MNARAVLALVAVLALSLFVWAVFPWFTQHPLRPGSANRDATTTPSDDSGAHANTGGATAPTDVHQVTRTTMAISALRPDPPSELAGYYEMTPEQQLDAITRIQHDSRMSPQLIAFLGIAIKDKTRSLVVRNNMANCLILQRPPNPHLDRLFLDMVDDTSESLDWREYAVQHLASTVACTDEPDVVIAKLRDLLQHGQGSIPATVMVHLDRLEGEGQVRLDSSFVSDLVAHLNSPATSLSSRMTIIGLLGKRQERSCLPLIRAYAVDSQPSLRRVAIAALGHIGDVSDRPLIEKARNDADALVVAAATSALGRLPPENIRPVP